MQKRLVFFGMVLLISAALAWQIVRADRSTKSPYLDTLLDLPHPTIEISTRETIASAIFHKNVDGKCTCLHAVVRERTRKNKATHRFTTITAFYVSYGNCEESNPIHFHMVVSTNALPKGALVIGERTNPQLTLKLDLSTIPEENVFVQRCKGEECERGTVANLSDPVINVSWKIKEFAATSGDISTVFESITGDEFALNASVWEGKADVKWKIFGANDKENSEFKPPLNSNPPSNSSPPPLWISEKLIEEVRPATSSYVPLPMPFANLEEKKPESKD